MSSSSSSPSAAVVLSSSAVMSATATTILVALAALSSSATSAAATTTGSGHGNVIFNMLFSNFLLDVGGNIPTKAPVTCTANHSVCYNIYNVKEKFSLLPPWSNTSTRMLLQTPSPPELQGTEFWLYTNKNSTKPTIVDLNNITSLYTADFNEEGKVWVTIHGFRSRGNAPWMKLLVGELLRSASNSNVVVLHWAKGSSVSYTQAIANLRVVARQLAYFLHTLQNVLGFPMSSLHLIGHSLGAHLAGIAGTYMQDVYSTKLHRITGLDPAHPYHNLLEPVTYLDRSDALFVDIIHSDNTTILGFPLTVGIMDAIGHLDYYPNGGGNHPGCDVSGDLRCAHRRAIVFFVDSIRQECPFIAVRCPSYELFLQGECWGCEEPHECSQMGMASTPLNVPQGSRFYLITRDSSPYCGYQYLVSVGVSNTTAALDHDGEFGILLLTMVGKTGTADPIRLSDKSVYYRAGTTHKYVVLAPDIGMVTKVRITFVYPGHFINPMSWRLSQPRLHLNKVVVNMLGAEWRSEFCFETREQKSDLEYILTRVQDVC
uniref:Pancreatic lipase-related protein 2-like n=2 Tax=Hirondellea gigas TaxID=1518452 RepID=A0A2P2I6H1_9CRUS